LYTFYLNRLSRQKCFKNINLKSSIDPPCKDGNARFKAVAFKHLSDKKCVKYRRLSDSKSVHLILRVSPLLKQGMRSHFRRKPANENKQKH